MDVQSGKTESSNFLLTLLGPCPYSPTEVAKKQFDHRRRGVQVWVKILLRAIAKSTFEIRLGVTPNVISTRKNRNVLSSAKGHYLPSV